MVKSIFDATMCECTKELEQQANDMDVILTHWKEYMQKYNVNLNDVIYDLRCVLEE